ncbi:uncharacterized protein LOC131613230 [Vicia villosa]|uniref:uncharacterized protein LOC131613230 n=1 Tax=Vicia villosa TaxID=3911 RepID=UPI00273CE83C|nr:uncharacterized protein LOC131613230 [Vicia villosa]
MLVLVNGSPIKKFTVKRGLRQGDPISPFLFDIVAEGLKGLVYKPMENGDNDGFNVNGKCFFGILHFMDDTLLVREGNWKHLWAIKLVLRGFELVSGLGTNFHKSKLIGININPNFMEAATMFLSFRMEDKEITFLGIPIGSNPRRISSWSSLLLKMKKRLSSWNGRMVNFGRWITLLKTMLSSILVIITLTLFIKLH